MAEKIKVAKLTKQQKEASIIIEVLSKYGKVNNKLENTDCNSISIAECMFIYEQNPSQWVFGIDYTFCNTPSDIFIVLNIIQEITKAGVKNIEVDFGYLTCFNKKGVFEGTIMTSDIYDLMEIDSISFQEAKNILKKKALVEYRESVKKK